MISRSKTKPKPTSLRRRPDAVPADRAGEQHEVVDAALCAIIAGKDRVDGATPCNATNQITASSPSDEFRVLGFAGFARSGKDTAAQAFPEYKIVAIATPIRKAALLINPIVDYKLWLWRHWFNPFSWFRQATILPVRLETIVNERGWEGAKLHSEIRRFLQRYGTEGGRAIHGDECWIFLATMAIHEAERAGYQGVVVPDVRLQSEVEMIHRYGGPVILIQRPGTWPVNSHCTESTTTLAVDFVVVNNSERQALRDTVRRRVETWYAEKDKSAEEVTK